MGTSIGSIFDAKELAQTYQPLLLCEFDFGNGNILRVSTHALASGYYPNPTTSGSYEYGGVPWFPRIINQDIGATQAMSDIGVDIVPRVQVQMADPDKDLMASWELAMGFKGAVLRIYAVMIDVGNLTVASFSTDSPAPIKFIGTCSAAATMDDRTITVTATSLLNMTQQQMPPTRIQPLCYNRFPPDASARADGTVNQDSPFFDCGYGPDQPFGVGNLDPATGLPFTSCDLSRAECIQRLGDPGRLIPIMNDVYGRATGRFGGFEYIPNQNNGLQRSYVSGQWDQIINAVNEARYGDYIPLCYGRTWVEPEIMGSFGDDNYSWFEAMLCMFPVKQVIKLIVNGDEVAHLVNDYLSDYHIDSPAWTMFVNDNWWNTVNNGFRNGHTGGNPGWGNKGDPYGSCSAIGIQILKQLGSSSSLPQVQALLSAGYVRIYDSVEAYHYGFTDNPAWILLDLHINANWRFTDINIQSFIDAAAYCDEQIYFNRLDGSYANIYSESDQGGGSMDYHRFSVGFTIRQRSSMGEVVRGVRNAMRGMLFFDFQTGKLTLICKKTLADQQPSPITGSNYVVAVPSVTSSGVDANGYVAYNFDEGSILKDSNGKSSLVISQRTNEETPNKAMNVFFDRENQYSQDISTIIDVEDVNRVGCEVNGTFNLLGPQTFDHVNRVTATWMAENYRGNPRLDYRGSFIGDTGGTISFEFQTTIKGVHLMVGHICLISDQQFGISNQLIRIVRIQPSQNFETARITAWWHNDNWYQDTYGQGANQPIYKNPMSAADSVPRSWEPGYEVPQAGDAYNAPTKYGFGLGQTFFPDLNGNIVASLQITGIEPVNTFESSPLTPRLELVGIGDTGGGYLHSTAYFAAISAMASDGTLSPLSNTTSVKLSITQTALDFVVQSWPATAAGYYAFVGNAPNMLSFQTAVVGSTPSVISLKNTYNVASWGPPDKSFASFEADVYLERHAGVWGSSVVSVDSSHVEVVASPPFADDLWAGRELQVLGIQWDGVGYTPTPIANFPVAGNTGNVLHLAAGDPTTCVYGNSINAGDAVAMRMKPTFGSDTNGHYFEDLLLINALNPLYDEMPISAATNASPIVLTIFQIGIGRILPYHPGDTVVVAGVTGNTGANGTFTVAAVDNFLKTITLASSSGTGTYTGGGTISLQDQGLYPGDEVGMVAFFVAGTGAGTFAKIKSNTSTRCYITGNWPVIPDSTSRLAILNPSRTRTLTTPSLKNANPGLPYSYTVDLPTFSWQTVLVSVGLRSANGVRSLQFLDPFREIFLFVQPKPTVISFGVEDGSTGISVTPVLLMTKFGSFNQCLVFVKASDAGVDLAFNISQNGSYIFSPNISVAHGTAPGTLLKFSSPTSNTFSRDDTFSVDILAGSSSWKFTAQLQ